MADILDQLIAEQNSKGLRPASAAQLAGTANAGVAQPLTPEITVAPNSGTVGAGDSFFFQPTMWEQNLSPAQQRQDLNLDILRTKAAQGRFELERAQQTAPIEDRLRTAQAEAYGSHDRFLRDQDAQVAEHTTGFLEALTGDQAPNPQDGDVYDKAVLQALIKFPRAAETAGGKAIMEKLGKTRGTHDSIMKMAKDMGMDVNSIRMGPNGPSIGFSKKDPKDKLLERYKAYGLTEGLVKRPVNAEVGRRDGSMSFKQDVAGDIVRLRDKEGKWVEMSIDEFVDLGGPLGQETINARKMKGAAPTPTPVITPGQTAAPKRKVYNPQTGRVE